MFSSTAPQERSLWLDRARMANADIVRIGLPWSSVAGRRPARPQDQRDPAYRWDAVDAAVRDATARGLQVLLSINGAPRWAEQGRPRGDVPSGAWKPDPDQLGRFAAAAAHRYSGATPDPDRLGSLLPPVRSWQIWNEPNLARYLAPQWVHGKPFAPRRYREMLAGAAVAIKAVDQRNVVVTAGTAPYGDPNPGGSRIMPVRFWRELLCLRGRRLRPVRCRPHARFDAVAHHPYGVGGPRAHARNRDDAAVPDIARITRVVRTAVRRHRVQPARHKDVWITEISWDSRPPDPDGIGTRRHARWLADALARLWHQGVDVVFWFRLRDQPPKPSFGATNQSGLYLLSGAPKRSLRAFRFPLSCRRARRGALELWGRAPSAGRVVVERRSGGVWRPARSMLVGPGRVFTARVRGSARVRARTTSLTSLACR